MAPFRPRSVMSMCLLAASSSLESARAFQSVSFFPSTQARQPQPRQQQQQRRVLAGSVGIISPRLSMSTLEEAKANSGSFQLADAMRETENDDEVPYFLTPVDQLQLHLQNGSTNNSDNNNDSNNENKNKIITHLCQSSSTSHEQVQVQNLPPILQKLVDKVGKIDESRIISSREYQEGKVPQLFSNIEYKMIQQPNQHGNGTTSQLAVQQSSSNSFLSSSLLLTGTALGSGLLTLPNAISPILSATTSSSSSSSIITEYYGPGFLPSLPATLIAWTYMTISALLTSELLINRYGETGRVRNVGLLELYTTYLGKMWGKVAGVAFLCVSYLMMGVYLSEGGDRLNDLVLHSPLQLRGNDDSNIINNIINNNSLLASRALFATIMGTFLSISSKYNFVQRVMTNLFVPVTLVAITSVISTAASTADFGALVDFSNQHPEVLLNAFPLLFMSWTYHGVVPRVVYDLEGNKEKITKAIVGGSTTALVVYLAWNAVMIGNVLGEGASAASFITAGGGNPLLGLGEVTPSLSSSVALVTEMAVVTSLIGVVLGFVNEFYDAIGVGAFSSRSSVGPTEDNKWTVALLTLLPPALVSVGLGHAGDVGSVAVDNVEIIEYAGAFGASTLFLVLPALMAWQCRYGDDGRPLTVQPMVPFGKIALGSLYKAAGTLIVEQGLEKLGVFEFVQEYFLHSIGA